MHNFAPARSDADAGGPSPLAGLARPKRHFCAAMLLKVEGAEAGSPAARI